MGKNRGGGGGIDPSLPHLGSGFVPESRGGGSGPFISKQSASL